MSLRTRVTVGVAAIVALAVIGGAYAAHYSTAQALRSETDKFLRERATAITGRPSDDFHGDIGGAPNRDADDGQGRYFDYDAVTQVLATDGVVKASIPNQPKLPIDAGDRALARSGGSARYRNVTVNGRDYRMVTVPFRGGGAAQIARRTTETDDVLDVLRNKLVVIALAGIAIATLVAWLIGRRITKPIGQLTATAEHIATTEDLTTPIPVEGHDEVGRLAAAFNTMLVALDTSREQQRRLVVDASHELRTPLAAVRTNIDFLAHAPDLDAAERVQLVAETRLELDELTNLVSEMVELATDVRSAEPVEPVELGELVDDVATRYRRRTGREISVTLDAPAVVDGRRAMLDRAVSNLVDNALKFSADPAPVELAVRGARVEVSDRGRGIAEGDLPHVFDRFYRAPDARTLPGSGLGLSIVAQIAALHGGSATMRARDGGGIVACLELDAAAMPAPELSAR
jgi:two-component system sensor histidine kinase MprB